jgi:hypothetical protein
MMVLSTITASQTLMRWPALVVVVLFACWMARSMYESWRRLRTLHRHRLEEAYDIARFIFGLITAGLIIWLLLTPPPHQLTRGLLAAFIVWTFAYLGLFGFLAFLLARRRARRYRS